MDAVEITVYVLGVVLLGSAQLWKQARDKKKALLTPEQLLKTYNKSAKIYSILSDVRDQFQCKRAVVFQFQNGGKWHSGESVQRMSITHEVKYYDLKSIKAKNQGVLVSAQDHPFFGELLQFKLYSITNIETAAESSYRTRLQYRKVRSAYHFLLSDKDTKRPIGMLVLTYPIADGLDTAQILDIKDIVDIISATLME